MHLLTRSHFSSDPLSVCHRSQTAGGRLRKTRTFASPAAGWEKDIKILQKSRLPHPPGRIQTTMRARGCGRLALPLLLLSAAALAEGDAKGLKEGETPGNFMEDEQWLSSISQYSGKIKHWNRFRDVSLQGRGSARGVREGASEQRPWGQEWRCPWQPRAPAAQPDNCTESKQRAPTGLLNPFLIFPTAPELATPSPIHTCPE